MLPQAVLCSLTLCHQYVFHNLDYAKPFLATYVSTSLFSIYLIGFIFFKDWICDAYERTIFVAVER